MQNLRAQLIFITRRSRMTPVTWPWIIGPLTLKVRWVPTTWIWIIGGVGGEYICYYGACISYYFC